ncbi:MAG TPA: FtsX-like permease family protein, partial [Streptosporangiaceae bacterium]
MRAVVRWIHADMRASVGQAIAVAGVVAGVVSALLLSAGLLQGATNPWQGLFTASRGAHIWLHLTPGTDAASLRPLPDVTAISRPEEATAATAILPWQRSRVELRAMSPVLPAIGRPLMASGRWLSAAAPGSVVLEVTFAEAVHAAVGDSLTLDNVDGSIATRVRVAGLAETADQGFYPDQTPGLIWVLPGLLQRVEPDSGRTQQVVGLQIADPARTGFVVQEVVTQVGSSAVGSVSTWQQVKQSMARRDPLLGLVLALFGLVALGAAVLAIINVTSGRVLVQHGELGMLQTLGFTPAQLTLMLTAEHALLTGAGIAVGLLGARLLMPLLLGAVPGGSPASVAVPAGWSALIVGGTFVAVLLATAAPAWRAGRVWPVAAVRAAPRGHLSRLATTAMATRLPPAMVLGSRAAFVRRMSAVLTIAA